MDCKIMKKKSETCRDDRISDLSDDLIGRILSLMPTKDAVRTSVLSRYWEYKWTSNYNIDIDDYCSYKGERTDDFFSSKTTMEAFVNFVERTILLTPDIKIFSLSMSCENAYDPARITAWINAALMRNVEILEVFYDYGGIVLPRGLLHNSSLRSLDLDLPCTFRVPASCTFPRLKSLNLRRVRIVNVSSSSDTLVLTFPVLETLLLSNCKLLDAKMVEVHAPSLTTLTCHASMDRISASSIKILSTDSLKFIYENVGCLDDFIFIGQQVVSADLVYIYLQNDTTNGPEALVKNGIHARKLLKEFSYSKELWTGGSLTKAIAQTSGGVSRPICLRNLMRLVVSEYMFTAKGLLELLNAAPSLKFLELNDMCNYADTFDYDAVGCVPICIKDGLEEVIFGRYCSCYAFAKFLLENGRKLKKVHVKRPGDIEKFSTFPKCSTSLTFVVDEAN